jgi:hypothetical protein
VTLTAQSPQTLRTSPRRAVAPRAFSRSAGSRGRSSRHSIRTIFGALALLGLATIAPSAASAAQSHAFKEAFAGPGDGAGRLQLVEPHVNANPKVGGSGLAVDEETGDLYVADTANHRVSEFSSTGAFIRAFGWGVADGSPELEACALTCQEGISGHEPGQLEAPTFLAVDNDPSSPSHGDLYVADTAADLITKFTEDGALAGSWGTAGQLDGSAAPKGPFGQLKGLTVDHSGDLIVLGISGEAFVFNPSGDFAEELPGPVGTIGNDLGADPSGIAIGAAHSIYSVDAFGAVVERTSSGSTIGNVTRDHENPGDGNPLISGLATNSFHDDLYADEEGTAIANFSPQCEPALGLCTPSQLFGEGHLEGAAGLAVDSQTGTVYAADTAADQIAVFAVAVEATIEAPTEVTATTAVLHGQVDPEGSTLSTCKFEYSEGTAEGQSVPCAETSAEIGSGTMPVPVHAEVTGLSGGTAYRFRLRATNAGGDVKSEEEGLQTAVLPVISEAQATEITAGSAILKAKVDPRGVTVTACRFEYGTSTAYGTTVPCQPAGPGAGTSPVPVSAAIAGLSANTTYHWRLLASDANGTATGADHTFIYATEGPAAGPCPNQGLREANNSTALPDCRAYELVTPAQKNGALIGALFVGQTLPRIAADGSDLIASSIQCFAGAGSCTASRSTEGQPFEFARTASGWVPAPYAPPASRFRASSRYSFDPDAHTALFGVPNAAGGSDFYARQADGSFLDIGPVGEGTVSPGQIASGNFNGPASTADLSHVVYSTTVPVWPYEPEKRENETAYEYVGTENPRPLLVGVSGGPGSTALLSDCGTPSPSIAGGSPHTAYNRISADGRTVFFTARHSTTCTDNQPPVNELFARVDGELPDAHTVAISEPNALSPAPPDDACTSAECEADTTTEANFRDGEFEGASADGSRVFFTSTQQLTDEGSEDPYKTDSAFSAVVTGCAKTTGPGGCNLYLYDFSESEGRRLIDLSAGAKATGGPRVQGAVAISPGGTHVYFVAKGVLTEVPNAQGQSAAEGAENLYLYERDASQPGGRLVFVATLASADSLVWTGGATSGAGQGIGIANVTPDGRYLVFPSHRGLTADAAPGEGAAQVYRYDAVTEQLTRVSIGRRGLNDDGNAGGGDASIVKAFEAYAVVGSGPAKADPTMSDDGRFIFFQSPKALVPGALNDVTFETNDNGETLFAQNVYEWEAEGTEVDGHRVCEEAGGCVSLISDGAETAEGSPNGVFNPELLGTDASGEDVFFAAADPLTWADTDTQRDYYDARVNGGFAPPGESAPCQGDTCKGPAGQAGAESSPATSAFNGPGNVKPVGCKKTFVKKHGRCVRQKARRHPKKHKARHHKRKSHKKRSGRDHRGQK